jgi:hypothetical protein
MESLRISDESEEDATVKAWQEAANKLVQNFFRRLPTPEQYESASEAKRSQTLHSTAIACQTFVTEVLNSVPESLGFGGPALDFLALRVVKLPRQLSEATPVQMMLAMMGLEQGVPEDDQSNKARLLRYCVWNAQGRKDETSPFAETALGRPASTMSKAFLPDNPVHKTCDECHKEDANTLLLAVSDQQRWPQDLCHRVLQ